MKSFIKPMEPHHLSSVGALADQLGYKILLEDLLSRFKELSNSTDNALFVLEEREDKVWMHLQVASGFLREKRTEIKALIVDDNYRIKGLGKALLEIAREWAKTNRLSTIYLTSNIMREKAHTFYEREGFEKLKMSHYFELKI